MIGGAGGRAVRGAGFAALVCVAVHAVILSVGFVYDDHPYVVDNADLRGGLSRLPRLFVSSFPSHAPERGLYRPLTAATLLVDRTGGDLVPIRFHATNLVLAALVVLAAAAALRRVAPAPAAAAGALLFAVHPVHVEAIAWITGRSELLAALFACLSFALAVDAARGGGAGKVVGAAGLLFVGMLSKENAAVALPLVLLAVGLDRGPEISRRRVATVIVALGIALGVALGLRAAVLGALGPAAGERVGAESLLARLPLVVAATGEHLRLLVWPHPLSVERMPIAPESWGHVSVLGGLFVIGIWALVAVAWRGRPDRQRLLLWPVVALLPVMHLVPIGETVAERFLVLPSVGYCGLLGVLLVSPGDGLGRRLRLALLVGLAVAGAVASATRAAVWRDEVVLWQGALRHAPESPATRAALGDSYNHRGDPQNAVFYYRQALEIQPDLTVARLALAGALDALGRGDEALAESREAVRTDPDHPVALNNLGARLARQGRIAEARPLFRRAAEIAPRYAPGLRNAALAALDEGDRAEARRLLARARECDPSLPGLREIERRLSEP